MLWNGNILKTRSESEEAPDGAAECQSLLLQAGTDPFLGSSSYSFTRSAFDGLLDSRYVVGFISSTKEAHTTH